MKENLLGQKYIDEEEARLLELVRNKEMILQKLFSNSEIQSYFNTMSSDEILNAFKSYLLNSSIEELKHDKTDLEREIQSLQEELEELKVQKSRIEKLLKQKSDLEQQIKDRSDSIETELDQKRRELEERIDFEITGYRSKKMQEAREEIDSEKARLKDEIEILSNTEIQLQKRISSLLSQIEMRNVSSGNRRRYFEFEQIDDKSDFYDQNHWTIDNYYRKKVLEYSIETGLEYEEAKKEFDSLSGSFCKLVNFLSEGFSNSSIKEIMSIRSIFMYEHWNEAALKNLNILLGLINGSYLPNYEKLHSSGNRAFDECKLPVSEVTLRVENTLLKDENMHLREKIITLMSKEQTSSEQSDCQRKLKQ